MNKPIALAALGCVALVAAATAVLLARKPPDTTPEYVKPALSGWVPPSLDPKPIAGDAWTFQFPPDASALPTAPVNEPHITLNLGHAVPIHALKLSAEPGGAIKAWVSVADDEGKEEVVSVGEASGTDAEMVIPWRIARRRIAAIRLSYKPGPPGIEIFGEIEPKAMRREIGKSYSALLPPGAGEPDDPTHQLRSTLVVLENGKPLSAAHALHDHIRKLGGGRYSHWGDTIIFSSSDGSDPRTNGRKYTLARPKRHEMRLRIS